MSWLEEIPIVAPILGSGATCATIAAAIYKRSIDIESQMRPEVKKAIAQRINRTTINPDSQVTVQFINHIFEAIFGQKHWTINCLMRSILASSLLFIGIT